MKGNNIELIGKITKISSGSICNVEISINKTKKRIIKAYLSGKMIKNNIKITKGDTVAVTITPYDINKARVYKRYD